MSTHPGGMHRGLFGPRPTIGAGAAAKAVAEDLSALVRAELALARAEVLGGVKAKATGAALLAAAGALAALVVPGLLLVVGFLLAEVGGLPGWAAALIVTLGLLALAAALALIGRRKLATAVRFETTRQTIEEDIAWTRTHLARR